jgi:hypothetical protein
MRTTDSVTPTHLLLFRHHKQVEAPQGYLMVLSAPHGRTPGELRTGNDLAGNGRDLIETVSQNLPRETEKYHGKSQ